MRNAIQLIHILFFFISF